MPRNNMRGGMGQGPPPRRDRMGPNQGYYQGGPQGGYNNQPQSGPNSRNTPSHPSQEMNNSSASSSKNSNNLGNNSMGGSQGRPGPNQFGNRGGYPHQGGPQGMQG